MTADEFERGYAARAGMTVEALHALGLHARPCRCGAENCDGWQMLSDENWDDFAKWQAGVGPEPTAPQTAFQRALERERLWAEAMEKLTPEQRAFLGV